jgi:hypothetical protein
MLAGVTPLQTSIRDYSALTRLATLRLLNLTVQRPEEVRLPQTLIPQTAACALSHFSSIV